MTPDLQKIKAVQEWPTPATVKEVRRFLGLASYYRRYIQHFADISKPLNSLTQKDALFEWSSKCDMAFQELKAKLITAPILAYPRFHQNASHFVLQTDASATGLGAVLEQDGHVIAYASRTLNKAEQQYSVIQKECLAAVYAMKQFRHYLLGRPFTLVTDHAVVVSPKDGRHVMSVGIEYAGIHIHYPIPEWVTECKCRCTLSA